MSGRPWQTLAPTLALTLSLGGALGCAEIPPGEAPPRTLPGEVEALPLRLAVGALNLGLAVDESAKASVGPTTDEDKYDLEEVVDYVRARRDLADWLRAGGSFSRVRLATGPAPLDRRLDAWSERDDLLLELEVADLRTRFEGHNWLWIPNLINWAYWIVPSWFVATEEYSLEFTAKGRLETLSGAAVETLEVPVRVAGTFGDFQRGWQFFGPIYPINGPDNWRQIAAALWPAAQAQAGRRLAEALRKLSPRLATKLGARELSKTLLLSIGIANYSDAVRLPGLPYAVQDARALSAAWAGATGLQRGQLLERHEAAASLAGVEQALAELRDRARPGDAVVVCFSGYGWRDPAGRPALLLNGPGGGAPLALERLAELLAQVPGEKLLLLDCGFDGGQARAVRGGPSPVDPAAEVAALAARAQAGILLASGAGGPFLTPAHLEGSLFAHSLIDGLAGPADRDQDGTLAFAELADYVRRQTTTESAFLGGQPQRPLAAGGLELRWALPREVPR